MENVLSFADARALVEEHAARLHPGGAERVRLLDANGRVLAQQLICDRDQPPFNRSARDGFAVQAAEVTHVPARLKIAGELRAGASWESPLTQGEALEIMTGAGVPEGADAVVMVEYTERDGNHVVVQRAVQAGENVVARGAEARKGQTLLEPGARVNHAVIALAASVGVPDLDVFTRPRVSVLATGDELVPITATPGPAEIRNSNSYSLAAQIARSGGEPVVLEVAKDQIEMLRRQIGEGMKADLLLLSGGVSMGKYDLVEQVLREFGAEFLFTGVKIQPGKPLVFGRMPRGDDYLYFFGLPGNPVSTMVTFALFVDPVLRALGGETARPLRFLRARLKSVVRTKAGLTRFLPARLSGAFHETQVELAEWHGSGDIAAVALSDCLIVVPPDREQIAVGEWIPVVMM